MCHKANQNFLHTHEFLAKHTLKDIQHIVIFLNGKLHLWKQDTPGYYVEIDQVVSPATEDAYNLRKTLIHKSAELNIIWISLNQNIIGLETMQEEITRIGIELENLAYTLELPDNIHQKPLLDMITPSQEAIFQAKSCCTRQDVVKIQAAYLQAIKPIIKSYGMESTKIQLHGLNNCMKKWSSGYDMALETSRIIVVGGKGPREGMIEIQYFKNCYKNYPENPDEYIRYCESPTSSISTVNIPHLIEEWAKERLNQYIALDMLGDIKGMNKDVLASYAPDVLDQMNADNAGNTCPIHKL